jgi:hypothetical protein
MCGDLDEEDPREAALYTRFRTRAAAVLRESGANGADGAENAATYMEKLFADALSRCVCDGDAAEESRRYELLSLQPIVLARLAGFLAAHVSLREDPLRSVIDALMHGYSEAERIESDHGHSHEDEDGHSHAHNYHHHD